jgi:molecular chaperone DnaJ
MGCGGRGSTPKEKCSSCSARGYIVSGSKEVEVQIPAGIENGSQMRIAGEGYDGKDLFLVVMVEKHPKLDRQGHFLVGRLEIPYAKMILGGEIEYEIFGSKMLVKIPPKSRPGNRINLKGMGMPFPQNPKLKGDLILDLQLKMPVDVSDEHRVAL